MKWLTIGSILVLIIGGIVYYFFVPASPTPQTDAAHSVPSLPISPNIQPTVSVSGGNSSRGSTLSLTTQSGSTVLVKDFIHNGETVADTVNPGSYVLAGSLGYCLADGTCPSGASTTDFAISYSERIQTFNISLLKEPLGTVRSEVEQFLRTRLGIPD